MSHRTGKFADHFSTNASAYANYRPGYPEALIAEIVSYAPGRSLAWDCATGNGQAARQLAKHFQRVLATDASGEQIRNAVPHERVQYALGREDESGAHAQSVDLVTVATALHWLDLDRFYAEVRRVVSPRGVLAAWGYGYPSVTAPITETILWFGTHRVARYWPPQRRHLENGFRELSFPFESLPIGIDAMTIALTREQFIGYVATWSAVAVAHNAGDRDPMPELLQRLEPLWPEDTLLDVTWPLYTKVGRVR